MVLGEAVFAVCELLVLVVDFHSVWDFIIFPALRA